MASQSYSYPPLRADEIRLLHLIEPDEGDGDPLFQLSRATLNDTLNFEAVSYTWGSTIRQTPILHQATGEVIKVTVNCQLALRNLTAAGHTTLWIDAVCINQDDVQERSQQVKLMNKIYRQAKATIAYLGEPDEHLPPIRSWTNQTRLHNAANLLDRPWNNRTWVIQEALLSKKLIFRLGSEQLSFATMAAFEHAIRKHLNSKADGVVALKDAYTERKEMLDEQSQHTTQQLFIWKTTAKELDLISPKHLMNPGYLFDVLCATSHYGCQDPRDKIFALLSLFDGRFPADIQPDYSIELEDLYVNVSRFLICYGVERVLSAAVGMTSGAETTLPTWVVNWLDLPPQAARGDRGWYYSSGCKAGWLYIEFAKRKLAVEPVGRRGLGIRGLRVSKINSRSGALPWGSHDPMKWQLDVNRLPGRRPQDEYVVCVDEGAKTSIVPSESKDGDWICVFRGFSLPYVLRPWDQGWKLVGECLIEDLMEGEAFESPEAESSMEMFVLY